MSKSPVLTTVFMFSLVLFAGCAHVPDPVIEDKLGKEMRTLSVTAERRVILVRVSEEDKKDGKELRKSGFCAEPPPDAAQNVSSALRAFGELSPKDIGKAKGDIGASLAISLQRLVNRSQGLQLYRDGMYFLCQSYLNGSLTEQQFDEASTKLLEKSFELINTEIKETHGKINDVLQAPLPTLPSEPFNEGTPATGAGR